MSFVTMPWMLVPALALVAPLPLRTPQHGPTMFEASSWHSDWMAPVINQPLLDREHEKLLMQQLESVDAMHSSAPELVSP